MRMLTTTVAALSLMAQAIPTAAQVSPEYWTLVPELRIGSIDSPDYALTRIGAAEVGPDGSVYVSQPQEGMIRVFDLQGRFLRSIGRKGGGPGEFQSIGGMGWRGDTLWVADTEQSRVTFFSPQGGVLDVVTIQGPLIPGISSRPTPPTAVLQDGSFLGIPLTGGVSPPGGIQLLRMSRTDALLYSFGSITPPQTTVVRREVDGVSARILTMPMVRESTLFSPISLAGGGDAVVLVHREASQSAARAFFRVEVLRSQADTVFSRRYWYEPRPITRPMADSIIAERRAGIQDAPIRPILEELTPELPPFQPPITAVVGGRDGTIWLRREEIGVEQVQWVVLDMRGEIVAWFHAPPGLSIRQAQRDKVWGELRDELDVPYLVRYGIRREGR